MTTDPTADPAGTITRRLARLRAAIGRYVWAEAVAGIVAAAAAGWWALAGLDRLWFELTKLEPPVEARGAAVAIVLGTVWLPLRRRLAPWLSGVEGRETLAATLERQRPDLDDRLMLAIGTAETEESGGTDGFGGAMGRRVAAEAAARLGEIRAGEIFDFGPLRRVAAMATAGAVSVGAVAASDAGLWRDWRAAFVDFEERYHERDTELVVAAVVPPDGGRRTLPPGSTHLHPRGADLELEIRVPEAFAGGPSAGRTPVVPAEVSVVTRSSRGRRRETPGVTTGPRTFRVSVPEPRDDLALFVRGGDYRHRLPVTVRVVDPPRVASAAVTVVPPDYLGGRESPLAGRRPLAGVEVEVPAESGAALTIEASRELSATTVSWSRGRLRVADRDGEISATITEAGGEEFELPASFAAAVATDPRTLVLPFLLTESAEGYLSTAPPGRSLPSVGGALAISGSVDVRIDLVDADGVPSIEPIRFEIRAAADRPPAVAVSAERVGPAVSDRVLIPLDGSVEDDHALTEVIAAVTTSRDGGDGPAASTRFAGGSGGRVFRFGDEAGDPAVFDTERLDSEPGDRFSLTVTATDGNVLTGPGVGTAGPFEFRVVEDDELLTALFNREVNLRRRFERAVAEVEGAGAGIDAAGDDDGDLRDALDRALVELRQNRQETAAVAGAFGRVVDELRFNRVGSETRVGELRRRVLGPLEELAETGFDVADDATARARGDATRAGEAVAAIGELASRMKAVLGEMRDLADLRESIRELGEIAAELERLRAEAERRRKKQVLDRLGGGLFE